MSYDANLPTARDRIRHRLGDIYEPPLRPDIEYDALLSQHSETRALMLMAESLASEYAQNPSSASVGGVSISYASLVSNWQAIAKAAKQALDETEGTGGSTMSSGIVRRPGMDTRDGESEYRRGMDDTDDWSTW